MGDMSRRELVRLLGGLLPAGALTVAANAAPPQTKVASAQAEPEPAPAPAQPAPAGPPQIATTDERQAQDIIASIKPAVVLLEVETESGMAWGSGFFVSREGLAITNRHVVQGAQKLTCLIKNKDKRPAKVLKIDPIYDLALVKVDVPGPVATVMLGDSDAVAEGQLIAVTGYPAPNFMVWAGMAVDSSTSRGSVNGLRYGGDVHTQMGDRALQIDAPVTHGNSGGPVCRLDTGAVIGVLASGLSDAGNVTFAVPINPVKVLIATAGAKPNPNWVRPTSSEAEVEPGDLRALNTIGVTRELPALFGKGFYFTEQIDDMSAKEAIDDWETCTGQVPPRVTPMTLHGDEIFFGSTDGKLRKGNLNDMSGDFPVLLDVGNTSIFIYPPVVNNQVICAAAGSLDLRQKTRKNRVARVLNVLSILGLGGSGGLKEDSEYTSLEGVGSLFGINRRNGSIDWEVSTGFVGTPVLYDGKVYYGGMGQRGCLEALQGREIWKKLADIKGASAEWCHIGHVSGLGVLGVMVPVEGKRLKDGSMRILGKGKARVESYEPDTGKLLWKTEFGDVKDRPRPMNTALFADENKKVVYALAAQVVAAVDATSGKLLWSYDHAKALQETSKNSKNNKEDKPTSTVNFTSHMVIHDGIIYVGSEDRKLYAFNGADGTEAWHYNTRGEVGQPTYYEGQILVGSRDGYIHVVDARTGDLNWRVATRRPVRSKPLVRAGMVYAATEYGIIHTVRVPNA